MSVRNITVLFVAFFLIQPGAFASSNSENGFLETFQNFITKMKMGRAESKATRDGEVVENPSSAAVPAATAAPVFVNASVDFGRINERTAFTYDLKTNLQDSTAATSFSADAALPGWLKLDPATGILTGTPQRPDDGDFGPIAFTASGPGGKAAMQATGVVVKVIQQPVWTAQNTDLGSTNANASFQVSLNNYISNPEPLALTYALSGNPPWMSVDANGVVYGTPTQAGQYPFTARFTYQIGNTNYNKDANFTVKVVVVPQPPYWTASVIALPQSAYTGAVFSYDIHGSAVDPQGGALAFTLVSGPKWASVSSAGVISGTPTVADLNVNKLVIQAANSVGSAQAEIDINVVQTILPPTWASSVIPLSDATEDTPYTFDLTSPPGKYVSDPQGKPLFFSKVTGCPWLNISSAGILSGTPDKTDLGLQKCQVSVSNHIASPDALAEIDIIVDRKNHAPYWVLPTITTKTTEDSPFSLDLSVYAQAPDPGDTKTYAVISGPGWATINPQTGVLSGTPHIANEGSNNVWTVRVTDKAGLYADTTVTVNVLHINHSPTWNNNPLTLPGATDSSAYSGSLASDVTDIDLPNDKLRFVKLSTTPAWLQVGVDGTMSGTPSSSDVGTTSFQVEVFDEANANATATINITVAAIQHPPTWRPPLPVVLPDAYEDQVYSVALGGTDTYVTNQDGGALKFTIVTGPAWMTIGTDGTITGVPAKADATQGLEKATVRVTNSEGKSADAECDVTVHPTVHPPVISEALPNFNVNERDTLSMDMKDPSKQWIYDPDGNPFTCSLSSPSASWLQFNSDCTFTATPQRADVGTHAFNFQVKDKNGFTSGALTITVVKVPRPPVWLTQPITATPLQAKTGYAFTSNVATLAVDRDGETTIFSKKSGPSWLIVSSNGVLSGTPATSDAGNAAFTLTVCNTDTLCNDGTLNVTVQPGMYTEQVGVDQGPTPGSAEYLWVMDFTAGTAATVQALQSEIHVFYETLAQAGIKHTGVVLSSDVINSDGQPLFNQGNEPVTLNSTLSTQDLSSDWINRVNSAYSAAFSNDADSSPLWALARFTQQLPGYGNLYHSGYGVPQVPLDVMIVTNQVDHFGHFTSQLPNYIGYTASNVAADLVKFESKDQKSLRVNGILPQCNPLIDTAPDASTASAPATAYQQFIGQTGGKIYPMETSCNFDPDSALRDFATRIAFRANVQANLSRTLKQTPTDPSSITLTIDGVQLPGNTGNAATDQWRYDAGSNTIYFNWYLIDQGQLNPGDQLMISYRVS